MLETGSTAGIGQRLRVLRKEHGLALADVAHKMGVSDTHISRLEAGQRLPSIGLLIRLGAMYDVSLDRIVGVEDPVDCAVFRAKGAVATGGSDQYSILSGLGKATNFTVLRLEVPPQAEPDVPVAHEGEEWLYVLKGKLELTLNTNVIDLYPGDAAHFLASGKHSLSCLSSQAASILLVTSQHNGTTFHV